MPLTHLIFDLDDTLYPAHNGLWDDIGNRINQYLLNPIGIEPERVNEVRGQYYQKYGTTLRGLMLDYPSINPADYLAYVHDIDLSKYIAPNPALNTLLGALPQTKVIFTNSDIPHANRVLTRLGIQSHFETIVDIRAMNFLNKPDPQAYAALFNAIAVPASQCVFVEDSLRNLRPAKALGMTTILIGNGPEPDEAVDYQAKTILEAGTIIRSIIEG